MAWLVSSSDSTAGGVGKKGKSPKKKGSETSDGGLNALCRVAPGMEQMSGLDAGLGMVATESIKSGDVMLCVPLSRLITPEVVMETALGAVVPGLDSNPLLALALFVCLQRSLGAASEWASYLLSTPARYDTLLSAFSDAEVTLLQSGLRKKEWAQDKAACKAQYDSVLPALQAFPNEFPGTDGGHFGYEAFEVAWSMVQTRSCSMVLPAGGGDGDGDDDDEDGALDNFDGFDDFGDDDAEGGGGGSGGGKKGGGSSSSSKSVSKKSRGRAAEGGVTVPALVPVGDLFNHDDSGGTGYFDADLKAYCFRAARDYAAGEPVHVSYGMHDNYALLRHYGFVLRDNLHHRVFVPPMRPANHAARIADTGGGAGSGSKAEGLSMVHDKELLLAKHCLNDRPTLYLTADMTGSCPVSHNLIAALRICFLNRAERGEGFKAMQGEDDGIVGTRNELDVWRFLSDLARDRLALYPTTIEEDEQALEDSANGGAASKDKLSDNAQNAILLRLQDKQVMENVQAAAEVKIASLELEQEMDRADAFREIQ